MNRGNCLCFFLVWVTNKHLNGKGAAQAQCGPHGGHAFQPEIRAAGFHLAIPAKCMDPVHSPTLTRWPRSRPLPVHTMLRHLLLACAEACLEEKSTGSDGTRFPSKDGIEDICRLSPQNGKACLRPSFLRIFRFGSNGEILPDGSRFGVQKEKTGSAFGGKDRF